LGYLFRIIALAPLFFIFISPIIMSKTYFISPDGNDEHDGTSMAAPWKSIDKVNHTRFQPGDSVLFKGGAIFREGLAIKNYGHSLENNPLFIGSYGQGRAIIKPNQTHGIYIEESGGIHIDGLIIEGEGRDSSDFHGILTYRWLEATQRQKNYQFSNLEVSGFNRGGISFYSEPEDIELGFADIKLHKIDSHHNGDHGVSVQGKVRRVGHAHQNIYISHVKAYHNYGQIGRTESHTGSGIVVGNTDKVLIEYCIAYENGKDNKYHYGGPMGIWLWDCNAGIIQFCESYANKTGSRADGGGFDLDGGCTKSVLRYNFSHHNDGAGYLIAEYNDARPLYENEVHHNISIHDGQKNRYGGIILWKARGVLSRLKVYDNFVFSSKKSNSFKITSKDIRNISVDRNFFIADSSAKLVNLSHYTSNLSFSKNLFHGFNGRTTFLDEERKFTSLEAWQEGGQIRKSPGKMYDHPNLGAWINQVNDPVFGRSLLIAISEGQRWDNPVDWDSLLSSTLPQPTVYPESFQATAQENGIVKLQWSLPDSHQLKEVIVERSLDKEEVFQEIARCICLASLIGLSLRSR
jgi:hypothetical protein